MERGNDHRGTVLDLPISALFAQVTATVGGMLHNGNCYGTLFYWILVDYIISNTME